MSKTNKQEIGRRDFLKASGGTAALAMLGHRLFDRSTASLVKSRGALATRQDEWTRSFCRMCVKPLCPIFVHIKDGVAVEIEGDPEAPANEGTLCPRAHGLIMNLYNPYRAKAPLKRTNPKKGLDEDPQWVEITWDEAYETIAERLKDVVAKDPRRIAVNTGYGSNKDYYSSQVVSNFFTGLGVPSGNMFSTNGPLCSNHHAMRMTAGNTSNAPEYAFCNYLIAMGGSLVEWAPASGPVRGFFDAIERGMKVVVVDPRAGKDAAVGEWLPIRPGSELAFSLAILHVMLYEIGLEKMDLEFLKLRSNAPYLIDANERYVRDPETNKPLVWDAVDNKAKTFDDPTIKDFALEGEYEVANQPVQTALTAIIKEMEPYTPEWSEDLTTISAATIRRITNEFVEAAQVGSTIVLDGIEFPFRPAAFFARRAGEGFTDSHYIQITRIIINGLVGALDVPGGLQGQTWGPVLEPNEDGLVTPTSSARGNKFEYPPNDISLGGFFPFRHNVPFLAFRAIIDPQRYYLDYDIDLLFIYGANSIVNNGAVDEPIEAFKKVPFVVSVAYHMDEPTQFADIVLPEPSNLEREVITSQGGYDKGHWGLKMPDGTLYRSPSVAPVYDAKQIEDILIGIAEKMGVLHGEGGLNERINGSFKFAPEYALDLDKTYTLSEIIDRHGKNMYGEEGAAEFKKIGYKIDMDGPSKIYNYAYFPMGQTRYHLFFEHQKEVGDGLKANLEKNNVTVPGWDTDELMEFYRPIPHWQPMPIHKEPPEYDMFAVSWKTAFLVYGVGAILENPLFYEISKLTNPYEMVILMNPKAAARKGISDGDTVQVESRKGKMTGKVKLSERVHPEVLGFAGNYGRVSMQMNPIAREGPNYNSLLNTDDGSYCPINTALEISPRVKVSKV